MDKPFKIPALLMLRRGMKLYVVSIVLMLFFTFIGWFFLENAGLKPGIRPIDQPIHEILLGAFSLQYLYGWADFLRLYAIFLVMSPLALWLLRIGKPLLLLLGSAGLWALYPVAHAYTGNSAELLMPLSWQLIFFTGLTIGFYWPNIQSWWKGLSRNMKRRIAIPILSISTLTLSINIIAAFLVVFTLVPEEFIYQYNALFSNIFHKESLAPLRLLLFALWMLLGFFIFTRYEKRIVNWFGWILLPFGKNSLYVYTLHAVLIFFAHLIIAPASSSNILVNFLGSICILGIILLAVKKKFLFKIIPR